jgi:hypothetical protein
MNINEFFQHVRANGVAKVSRFTVEIFPPEYARFGENASGLEFACESVEFPGRTLTTSDNRIYGPSFKTPYGTDYSEINLTFLCSEDMREKNFFDNWINFINPTTNFNFKYREEYTTDVKIIQLNEKNAQTYACKLYEAFPVAVNALQGNWADDGFHRVQVSMTYRYWEQVSVEEGSEALAAELKRRDILELEGGKNWSKGPPTNELEIDIGEILKLRRGGRWSEGPPIKVDERKKILIGGWSVGPPP